MATTGRAAWEKYFKGKGDVATVTKKDSTLFGADGKTSIGFVKASEKIIVLATDQYTTLAPITKESTGTAGYIRFENIQKPLGARVSGIKLKPQHFVALKKETWKPLPLAEALCSEIEDRQDLQPELKNYLIALTKHYGSFSNHSQDVRKAWSPQLPGLAEVQKDYGEILGAMACVTKKILAGHGIKISGQAHVNFPSRGNEPLVDYYLLDGNKKYSVSAKSGEVTNVLKPKDIMDLLESRGITNRWVNTAPYKFMQSVTQYSVVKAPFVIVNQLTKKPIVSADAMLEVDKFKQQNFHIKNYNFSKFRDLFKLLGINDQPTIGKLFYLVEKYVLTEINKQHALEELFDAAISGQVIYVKYKIQPGNPMGMFDVITQSGHSKGKIKFRSKNGQTRAADKIGLQP